MIPAGRFTPRPPSCSLTCAIAFSHQVVASITTVGGSLSKCCSSSVTNLAIRWRFQSATVHCQKKEYLMYTCTTLFSCCTCSTLIVSKHTIIGVMHLAEHLSQKMLLSPFVASPTHPPTHTHTHKHAHLCVPHTNTQILVHAHTHTHTHTHTQTCTN